MVGCDIAIGERQTDRPASAIIGIARWAGDAIARTIKARDRLATGREHLSMMVDARPAIGIERTRRQYKGVIGPFVSQRMHGEVGIGVRAKCTALAHSREQLVPLHIIKPRPALEIGILTRLRIAVILRDAVLGGGREILGEANAPGLALDGREPLRDIGEERIPAFAADQPFACRLVGGKRKRTAEAIEERSSNSMNISWLGYSSREGS